MSVVRLKSKVGPFEVTRRVKTFDGPGGYTKQTYCFSLEDDCRCTLPADYWDEIKDAYLDRQQNLRYRDAVKEL